MDSSDSDSNDDEHEASSSSSSCSASMPGPSCSPGAATPPTVPSSERSASPRPDPPSTVSSSSCSPGSCSPPYSPDKRGAEETEKDEEKKKGVESVEETKGSSSDGQEAEKQHKAETEVN